VTQPNVDANLVEQARRQVNRLAEEIAHLSEMDLPPAEYYGEFLQRVLAAIAAPAGAVWLRTPQGNLQLQYQIRMREVGLDAIENGRQTHDELLRQAVMRGQPAMLAPQSGLGTPEGGGVAAGNPTNFVVLIAPILVDKTLAGLVEVWQDPNRGPDAQRGFLQFLIKMASLASSYTRNHQLRQMSSQQQVWTQLETFTRNVHASLNPIEVAYQVANEGRRLIECDRVSVGVREGNKPVIRAISGADVIEKRSNLVQLMRRLFDEVLKWGEKLVYSGTKDDTLPPAVLRALDNYLEESNSKLLLVMPLRDTREEKSKRPARSILMMECFEPQASPEQMTSRMEVVAKHAASALYNAWEYRKIPFRTVWMPMAKVQEGLGGKTKAIVLGITFGVAVLAASLVVVPYPLKMEANGELLPKQRAWMYPPWPGHVVAFKPGLKSGDRVSKDEELIYLESIDLESKVREMLNQITVADKQVKQLRRQLQFTKDLDAATKAKLSNDLVEASATYTAKGQELEKLRRRTNADLSKPGSFSLRAPLNGMLLTADFQESLKNKYVQSNEPLLRVGEVPPGVPNPDAWEIQLKIPQKHIGQVRAAFKTTDPKEELDVVFLAKAAPTYTYMGKLAQERIASEATPDRSNNNEAEPVVLAWVRISGTDIPAGYRLPPYLLSTGTEVHSRVICGNHAMGYSLFYGVWEFIYEKVIFFF
jgi:hypothetical protein